MTISGLSSDTTISQTKIYLDEVRKIAGEASSTPTASVSTSTVTDTKGTAQSGTASASSPADSYNVYIKSDLSNVVGYAPGSTSATQPVFSAPPADQSSTSAAQSAGSGTTPVSSTAGSASSAPTLFGSSNAAPGTTATPPGGSQTPSAQGTHSTTSTGATQNDTAQDNDSDDVQAYSVLVTDLTMLASLIQSGDMPNARTTAGTVIKDLNNYLSQPSQNPPPPNGQTPKFVVQSFSSLLASVQEGDNTSASTIVNAIKVIS